MSLHEKTAFIFRNQRLIHRITVWSSWRVLNMDCIEKMIELSESGALKLQKDFLNDNEYLWELYLDIKENYDKYNTNDKVYIAKKMDYLNKKYDNLYHM